MEAGKVASQAGHAYLGAFLRASSSVEAFSVQAREYSLLEPGTKVCLQASLQKILMTQEKLISLGLPHFLVVDSGHQSFYNGVSTVTALGIGPLYQHQAKPVVGKFRLHK